MKKRLQGLGPFFWCPSGRAPCDNMFYNLYAYYIQAVDRSRDPEAPRCLNKTKTVHIETTVPETLGARQDEKTMDKKGLVHNGLRNWRRSFFSSGRRVLMLCTLAVSRQAYCGQVHTFLSVVVRCVVKCFEAPTFPFVTKPNECLKLWKVQKKETFIVLQEHSMKEETALKVLFLYTRLYIILIHTYWLYMFILPRFEWQ